VAKVQAIIETYGAVIKYLPHYSSELNPIEQVFSKLIVKLLDEFQID
jgi:transposase